MSVEIVLCTEIPATPAEVWAVVSATPAGTQFCWQEVLAFPWWMGGVVGERIAKPVFERVWRANLARLRAIVISGLSDR